MQVLQVLTFLVQQRPGILLVDEPDAHLHSSLQRTAVDVLRGAVKDLDMQVLLATHSKEIVNYVDPEDLMVVDRQQVRLEGLAPHESAISVLESLGSIDSVDAYYVLRHRRLLLVEGQTDTRVLHGFALKRGLRLFEGESRIVAIETGGDSTPSARSDLSVLEQMIGGQINSPQIRDSDSRLDKHVEREEQESPRPLHIWRKGSIESYLILPGPLARIVAQETGETLDGVASAIEDMIKRAIVELADDTFDRVSTRYRHLVQQYDDHYAEVSEANTQARSALADSDMRFRLTKGKYLLARVRLSIQQDFGVSFGNQRLVEEVGEEEVDPEVWTVIEAIVKLAAI